MNEWKKWVIQHVTSHDNTGWNPDDWESLYDEFSDFLHAHAWNDFCDMKYTEAMDKEVEAIWQRKNSKLAKVLL